jgi:hypothetical protein
LVLLVRPRTRRDEKSNNSLIQRERQRDRDREKKTERKKEREKEKDREREREQKRETGGRTGRQTVVRFICVSYSPKYSEHCRINTKNIITFKSRLLLARIFYFSFLTRSSISHEKRERDEISLMVTIWRFWLSMLRLSPGKINKAF